MSSELSFAVVCGKNPRPSSPEQYLSQVLTRYLSCLYLSKKFSQTKFLLYAEAEFTYHKIHPVGVDSSLFLVNFPSCKMTTTIQLESVLLIPRRTLCSFSLFPFSPPDPDDL